jgi:HPt (histidine-containing phosphotransfer) domain-containing protein
LSSAMDDPPDVDASVLDSLTGRLGERGPDFRTSLIATWHEEASSRLADLDAAVRDGDADGVARVAHTLKSGSASLGAVPLARVCDEIETRLRGPKPSGDLAEDAARIHEGVARTSSAFGTLWPDAAP